MKKNSFIETMVISIYVVLVFFGGLLYKKLDDTQNEWKQIVVKQGEHIKKLAEQNKAQDVIINKLNTDYNLKGSK